VLDHFGRDGLLERLHEIAAARAALDAAEAETVVAARLRGYSWAQLAEPLRVTAAGLRKRHAAIASVRGIPSTPDGHEPFVPPRPN
jgi:hypothetical protein